MLAYIETRIKEIKEEMSLEEVKEYFNDKCVFSTKEFGEVVNEFIIQPNHDILRVILSSKKFKEHNACVNEYGEPIVQAILYAIQAVCESDDIPEIRKLNFKESLYNILIEENNLNWNLTDINIDNPLHIILSLINCFSYEELLTLIDIALKNDINPLNKNCLNQNAIDVVMEFGYDEKQKQTIIAKLATASDKFIIEVKSSAYNS